MEYSFKSDSSIAMLGCGW